MIKKIVIDIPKIEGKGEDSPPLILIDHNCGAIGVFDGLGGSGGTTYEENGLTFTGAYIAARLVRDVCDSFLEKTIQRDENFHIREEDIKFLKDIIRKEFQEKLKDYCSPVSKLKSSLIRTFPTTAAMALWKITEKINVNITSLWAGDSRIYSLSPSDGLKQLTTDDLKMGNDPLENIFNDSPMSNVVQADIDYTFNQVDFSTRLPIILFAATDGCFGYYSTPMHFEYALLKTLLATSTTEEWESQLINELKNVSGDDCTLSLVLLGYENISFPEIREQFQERLTKLKEEFIKDLDFLEKEITDLKEFEDYVKKGIVSAEVAKRKKQRELWATYKGNYMLNPQNKTNA